MFEDTTLNNRLSGLLDIDNKIDFTTNNFSFVDTIASFINNNEFREGYRQFKLSNNVADAYIWEVLSAIGNDIGNVIYSNVINYVDYVSNIDLCKIQALKSMIEQLGIDYKLFDNIASLPPEIQHLINVLSINKRYLLDSKYLKSQFIEDLSAHDVISSIVNENNTCSSLTYDTVVFNQDKYEQYLSSLFNDLLSGMILMTYNIDSVARNVYVYPSLKTDYFTENKSYDEFILEDSRRMYKLSNNIELSFDEKAIVTDIEQNKDSLDNYVGVKLDLLNIEIEYRKSTISKDDIDAFNIDLDDIDSVLTKKTRYSYYRKLKVLEYANFVDGLYFNATLDLSSDSYDLDPNYYRVNGKDMKRKTVILNDINYVKQGVHPETDIDYSMIAKVASTLANMTLYILKLREKIKLLTRKNYMKGTNNLLLYVVNEYLIDYARLKNIDHISSDFVRSIYADLSAHDIEDLKVQEYWDLTEYYNIKNLNTYNSRNSNDVNEQFWNTMNGDGLLFKLNQINNFYLSTMMMKLGLSTLTELDEFLSTIYQAGANTSYVRDSDNIFHAKLNATQYTHDIYDYFVDLSTTLTSFVDNYMSEKIKYDNNTPISSQIVEITSLLVSDISSRHYAQVSAVYMDCIGGINELNTEYSKLSNDYNDILEGEYSFYFTKQTDSHCYDEYEEYMHNYYIDNDFYASYTHMIDKLDSLLNYITDANLPIEDYPNIANHLFIDTLAYDIVQYQDISQLVIALSAAINADGTYPYSKPSVGNVKTDIQNLTSFLNTHIDSRIQKMLTDFDSFREKLDDAELTINELLDTYALATSTIKWTQLSACSYMFSYDKYTTKKSYDFDYGTARATTDISKAREWLQSEHASPKSFFYVPGNTDAGIPYGQYYVIVNTWKDDWGYPYGYQNNNTFSKVDVPTSNDSLEAAINKIEAMSDIKIAFMMSTGVEYSIISDSTLALLRNIKTKLNRLRSLMTRILKSLTEYSIPGAKDIDGETTSVEQLVSKVYELVQPLEEKDTSNDPIVRQYRDWLLTATEYENTFTNIETSYDNLFTNSNYSDYLASYIRSSDLNIREMISLSNYVILQDAKNRKILISQVSAIFDSYYADENMYLSVVSSINVTEEQYGYSNRISITATYLDDIITDIYSWLNADMIEKERVAYDNTLKDTETMSKYVVTLSNSISALIGEIRDVLSAFQKNVDNLNFFTTELYATQLDLFLTYSGLSTSYYPYYNYKNVTHPSYQIHPYLWKFIEKTSFAANLSKVFFSLTVSELERENVIKHIDGFIGEFGQTINDWKNNVLDHSGYVTRYENSKHTMSLSRNKDVVETIDYDGSFYPNAIEMLRSNFNGCLSSFLSSTPGDFYDKYYKHLKLTNEEKTLTRNRLSVYWQGIPGVATAISSITANRQPKNIYDIYQYGIDSYKNSYILYKYYGVEDPTYKLKRDTLGDLWIRLAHAPIAFPAFSGPYPMVDLRETNDAFVKIASRISAYSIDEDENVEISNPMRFFYDFEFSRNKKILSLNSFIPFSGTIAKMGDKFATTESTNRYDHSWQIMTLVNQKKDYKRNVNMLHMTTYDNTYHDYIASGESIYNTLTKRQLKGRHYAFIGTFIRSLNEIGYVYVLKDLISDTAGQYLVKDMNNDLTVKVFIFKNCNLLNDNMEYGITHKLHVPQALYNDDICFTFNEDEKKLTFAVLVKANDKKMSNSFTKQNTIPVSDSEGKFIDDPTLTEFNSYDRYDADVFFIDAKLNNSTFATNRRLDDYECNLNADISYVPVYPSSSKLVDLTADVNRYNEHCIELLGESKNIEDVINTVNENVNPYFDYNQISSEYVFGRVYEDYVAKQHYSMSDNPAFNRHLYADLESDSYIWTLNLRNEFSDFTLDRLDKFNIIIYSPDSLGRNPYLLSKLRVLSVDDLNQYVALNYNEKITDANTSDAKVKNIDFDCYVAGTVNALVQQNRLGSNYIEGISSVGAQLITDEYGTCKIRIRFGAEDQLSNTYIDRGKVRVVIYDLTDLLHYEAYHFLDAYGMINAYDALKFIPEDEIHEYWRLIYDKSKYTTAAVLAAMSSYYVTRRGLHKYLHTIDLSQYSFLSDVYVLSGNDRLQFKYDEELHFDLDHKCSYYPSLNIKYPFVIDQVCDTSEWFDSKTYSYYKNVFNSRNMYVLRLENPKTIADRIGKISIPFIRVMPETAHGYEDYVSANKKNLGTDNVDVLQYIKFTNTGAYTLSAGHAVPIDFSDEALFNHTVDSFTEFLDETYNTQLVQFEYDDDGKAKDGVLELNINHNNLDLGNKLDIFANFAKYLDDDGQYKIELFFNYFNYFNSSYLQFDSLGRPLVGYIPETYLRLKAGESGTLKIIVLFKYCIDGVVYGYLNKTLLAYEIHNISDDKPKFVIRKTYSV